MVSFREGGFTGSWGKGEAGQEQPRFARGTLDYFLHNDELQSMGGTLGDTGRFQPFINPIFAIITFFNFSRIGVPLGSPPGAGGNTGFTSHTQLFINKNNTVLTPLLHGPGGTGRDTPGILTMKTRHKNKGYFWQTANDLGSHLNNLAGLWPRGKLFVGLARNFTGMASNTFFGILEQIIFTQLQPPALYN